MHIVRTVSDLRNRVQAWKVEGYRVGLVPTMGALHHGHLSLVDHIANRCDRVIVSVFVNPAQFGEGEDFDDYPREEASDIQKLSQHPAHLLYAPGLQEMYPEGYGARVHVAGLSSMLEGASRPGHFDGMATIVTKLLLQTQADIAIFGEKDYQQLCVIRKFVTDLDIPVHIIGGALVRESDGLAASSRNAYLSPDERRIAGQFNVILKKMSQAAQAGASKDIDLRALEKQAETALLDAGFRAVDYIRIADPDSLKPLDRLDRSARILAVARIGRVRLLDNMAIEIE